VKRRYGAAVTDYASEVFTSSVAFRIAASGEDGVRWSSVSSRSKPLQLPADLPARFIGRDDGAPAHLLAQGRIGGLRLARRAVDGMHQPTARHRQPVLLAKQCRDFAEREAQLFIQNHRERDGLCAQLHACGTEGIGGLPRVPALHPPAARPTLPDVNPELAHHHAGDREFFLVLHRDSPFAHGRATVGAGGRQRRFVSLIDATRPTSMRLWTILSAGFASRTPRRPDQRFRERSRLAMRRAARLLQLALHRVVLAPQLLILALQALALPAFVVAVSLRAFHALAQIVDGVRSLFLIAEPARLHATFMADSRKKYKYGVLNQGGGTALQLTTR
jgi:hypothetical protein